MRYGIIADIHGNREAFDRALEARPSDALAAAILWEKAGLLELSENWWLQWRTFLRLHDRIPAPSQQEQIRLRLIQPLLKLGLIDEARIVLYDLIENSALSSTREAARQQIDILEGLTDLPEIP